MPCFCLPTATVATLDVMGVDDPVSGSKITAIIWEGNAPCRAQVKEIFCGDGSPFWNDRR